MKDKAIIKFVERHQIQIVDSIKRRPVYKSMHHYFTSTIDYNSVIDDIVFDTEKLLTVQVTENELIRMAEFEEQVFNNMAQQGHYNMFETLMEQKEHEKYLKEKYPAVKNAYEQYSLILKMAQSGEL